MSSPARYANGVTNVASNDPLGQFLTMSPLKVHMFFDDFDSFRTTDAWVETTTTGTGTFAMIDGDGGQIKFTNSAGGTDNMTLQLAKETFSIEAGKKSWFAIRLKSSTATLSNIYAGLFTTNADVYDTLPTDGVYFRKLEDVTTWALVSRSGSVSSEVANIGTATTGWVDLAWYYDGVSSIEYFFNGASAGTLEVTPPTTELNVSMAMENSSAAAHTLTFDYILAAKER